MAKPNFEKIPKKKRDRKPKSKIRGIQRRNNRKRLGKLVGAD